MGNQLDEVGRRARCERRATFDDCCLRNSTWNLMILAFKITRAINSTSELICHLINAELESVSFVGDFSAPASCANYFCTSHQRRRLWTALCIACYHHPLHHWLSKLLKLHRRTFEFNNSRLSHSFPLSSKHGGELVAACNSIIDVNMLFAFFPSTPNPTALWNIQPCASDRHGSRVLFFIFLFAAHEFSMTLKSVVRFTIISCGGIPLTLDVLISPLLSSTAHSAAHRCVN